MIGDQRLRRIKRVLHLVALITAGVIAASASASGPYIAKSVYIPRAGSASFSVRILRPYKIILYGAGPNLKTSTTTVCLKGTTVSTVSRSFDTAGTRNLLYHIRGGQDVCYLAVAGTAGRFSGRLSVDVYRR
jgi:hypothetical protein